MLFRRAFEQREQVFNMNDKAFLDFLGIDPATVNVRGQAVLREATAYACIKVLSETLGKLPAKVYQETAEGIRKAVDHPLYRVLKVRPNPYMTPSVFLRTAEVQRNSYGNAYIWPEIATSGKMAGQVAGLYPLEAGRVQVWVDDLALLGSRNRLWYVVDVGGGERRRLSSEELIHLKAMTTDGYVGIAPLDYLKYLAENGVSATRFINKFYRQGLQSKGLVQYVGDLDDAARKNFVEKFMQMAGGLDNAHGIAMMPLGFQFQPLKMSMVDAQFLENTELTIRQIAAAFGVKAHQLGDLAKATYSNVEQQNRQFYMDTMAAIITDYEQELGYKLLRDSEQAAGFYIRFNVNSLARSDMETRYKSYQIGVQGGFLKPNEIREWEELPPADGGDRLMVNGAMVPITDAGRKPTNNGGGDNGGQAAQT